MPDESTPPPAGAAPAPLNAHRNNYYQRRPLAEMQEQMKREQESSRQQLIADVKTALAKPPIPEKLSKSQARIKVQSMAQEFLLAEQSLRNGKKATRLQLVFESLFRTALDKRSIVAVQAAKELLDRGFNKPTVGDPEDSVDAKKGGLTVVYVDRHALDESIPIIEGDPSHRLPAAPEFLDAEFTEDEPHDAKRT